MNVVLLSVFKNRGYRNITHVPSICINKIQCAHYTAEYCNNRTSIVEKIQCFVFPISHSIGKQDVKSFECIDEHLILIGNNISFQTSAHLSKTYYYFEFLKHTEISFNKMDHHLVPIYRLLNQRDIKLLKEKYQDINKYPKLIYRVDPIARIMDFRPGDVLEVMRKNSTVIMYRVVINLEDLS